MLSLIAAIAENGAIGKDNDLLWHISSDLKRFKALTINHAVIMGRRTFESLPHGPLPKRRNIVLTHDNDFNPDGVEVAHSVEEVLAMVNEEDDFFVMGGAAVYRLLLPYAKKLFITFIHKSYPDADVFFPPLDFNAYKLINETAALVDEPSGLIYHYADYEKA